MNTEKPSSGNRYKLASLERFQRKVVQDTNWAALECGAASVLFFAFPIAFLLGLFSISANAAFTTMIAIGLWMVNSSRNYFGLEKLETSLAAQIAEVSK